MPEEIVTIGDYSFAECKNLKSIEIPSTVNEIGEYAFSYCSNLQNINIPENIAKIKNSTFRNCTSIKNIHIPSSVTEIESRVFLNCNNLENIDIPNNILKIGANAFSNCNSIRNLDIPISTELGENVLYNSKIYLDIPYNGSIQNISQLSKTLKRIINQTENYNLRNCSLNDSGEVIVDTQLNGKKSIEILDGPFEDLIISLNIKPEIR